MKKEELLEIQKQLFKKCSTLLELKNQDYGEDNDALSNFMKGKEVLGMSEFKTWTVYFWKHIDAIMTAIKKDGTSPVCNCEDLEHRITDAINYLVLLQALIVNKGDE